MWMSSLLTLTHIVSLTGTMSSPQRPDCACRCWGHTRHTGLWCGTLDKTPAAINPALVTHCAWNVKYYRRCQHAASEPHSVSLHLMLNHRDLNWLWLKIQNMKMDYYFQCVYPPPVQSVVSLHRASYSQTSWCLAPASFQSPDTENKLAHHK